MTAASRDSTLPASDDSGGCVTRSAIVGSGMQRLAATIAVVGVVGAAATNARADEREPEITTKCYVEVRPVQTAGQQY